MSMNIFRLEFKMRLRSVITWSAAVAAVILVYVSLFSSFAVSADQINQLMANYPKGLLDAFGLNGTDLSTIMGFFGVVFLFVQICLAIQASNYGFSLVSVEEREWTADFLMSKPVKRTSILTGKLLAALAGLTITNAVVWVSSFAFINLFKGDRTYDADTLLLLLASIILFQLFFLGVGLVISLLVKRVRSVTPYSMGLAFGMYVLSVFSGLLGTSVLEKITPFKHFDPAYIVKNGSYDVPLVLVSAAVIVISIAGSYALYTRRDIPAVT
jgi:ABC-2 type transport system permease protein